MSSCFKLSQFTSQKLFNKPNVSKGCSVPQIRNASGTISEIAKYFNYSPKRQHFFEKIIDSSENDVKKSKLKDLCKTRWTKWIDSFLAFYELYPFHHFHNAVHQRKKFGTWRVIQGMQILSGRLTVSFITSVHLNSLSHCHKTPKQSP